MASTTKSKPSPIPFDDDDKWDIITAKEPPPQKPASPPTAVPPPNVSFGIPPPPMGSRPPVNPLPTYLPPLNPMQGGPPRGPFAFLPGDNVMNYPNRQVALETQLMQYAEVDIGLLNAADILENHLLGKKLVDGPYEIYVPTTLNSPGRVVQSPANRYYTYSNERQNSAAAVRDMAYLIGLEKAVKILRDAHEDPTRKDMTYSARVVSISPPPVFPAHQPMGLPVPMPPQTSINETQFRNIAKEIVKDTLKECKDDNFSQSLEEVQKEMISLCRDVCRDALARKE